jgi:hypothetical protein
LSEERIEFLKYNIGDRKKEEIMRIMKKKDGSVRRFKREEEG